MKRCLEALALCTILPAPGSVLAEWAWLRGSAISEFTDGDWAIFRREATGVLEDGADGVTVEWNNPETGAHGAIKPLATFMFEGRPTASSPSVGHAGGPRGLCKQLRVELEQRQCEAHRPRGRCGGDIPRGADDIYVETLYFSVADDKLPWGGVTRVNRSAEVGKLFDTVVTDTARELRRAGLLPG